MSQELLSYIPKLLEGEIDLNLRFIVQPAGVLFHGPALLNSLIVRQFLYTELGKKLPNNLA
jgi:hypothetical protein